MATSDALASAAGCAYELVSVATRPKNGAYGRVGPEFRRSVRPLEAALVVAIFVRIGPALVVGEVPLVAGLELVSDAEIVGPP